MATSSKNRPAIAKGRDSDDKQFLVALGQRVRDLRSRGGTTRKALAQATGVSERHLANLEYGEGNVSVLVLQEVASALNCPLAELIGDFTTASPEWLMIRSLLNNRDEQTLHQARIAIGQMLGSYPGDSSAHRVRIALIGLRGAGKSTLGRMLADEMGFAFVELSREIENFAGCTIAEIQNLYGAKAYRRYERRALEETIQIYPKVIIATPGGLVADPVNFDLLLTHCSTIWLQAKPEDHMQRVIEQGDFRPMAGNSEAMEDLRGILASRKDFYDKADFKLDTSGQPLSETYGALRQLVSEHCAASKAAFNAI
ncbi:MAG: XRE family aerobic/anaerobic benzoate catabolism transcriptional regulator [Gammaproteobacteria bacterium]|jgi:XRE family aerobic/anaerobic benzoate catabolism transcriptional regulator